MSAIGSYRIRWANVQYANGWTLQTLRMCIAERRRRFWGWWPVEDGDWRFEKRQSLRDIEHDKALCSPLPPPRNIR